VGRPRTQAKLIIHLPAVKSAVETLRAKIAQKVYTIGKYKFMVDSKMLNWINKA
jgi:hypothetical protein